MNGTRPRRSKKAPPTIAEIAATSFEAMPEAAALGRDRQEWRQRQEEVRCALVLAGGVLTKTPAELRQAVGGVEVQVWTAMLDAFEAAVADTRGLLAAFEAAHARGLIALAGIAEPEGVPC